MIEEQQKLIKEAIAGKPASFGSLYDHYQPIVYRFIYLKVSHKEEAEDLTHQVFLSAWLNISEFKIKKEASFIGWLYQISRNKVIDHYRTKKPTIDIDNIADPPEIEKKSSEETEDFKIEIKMVKRAIPLLNEIEQDVVIMRFIEDLKPKEVAEILKKSEGSIRLIQHRAINKLKNILNK